jgi:predicted nucleic acid-binding protein
VIVVDTNVVAAVIIRGATTPDAFTARSRDREWLAPRLLRSELLNAIAKYVVVAGTLDRDEAVKTFRHGLSLVTLAEDEAQPLDIFNLCARHGITAYDAEFVNLAISENVRPVTLDGAVLRAFPDVAVSLSDFSAGK